MFLDEAHNGVPTSFQGDITRLRLAACREDHGTIAEESLCSHGPSYRERLPKRSSFGTARLPPVNIAKGGSV